ncbi:molybdate ABC transporter substrate-binding protein [Paenibacillus sp. CMAA1364]
MLVLSVSMLGCNSSFSTSKEVELTISAAASLTNALTEIQTAYESEHSHVKLNFNFGASGALKQQIEQGAPVDLFLSAAKKVMNELVEGQWIAEDQQFNVLTNEMVVIVPEDSPLKIESSIDLMNDGVQKIAIGIPESVPAGNYAKEALTNDQLWDQLQPRLVQAKDVRQVLNYVETGNADIGFVYKTDALSSSKMKIAYVVDPTTYTTAYYPFGIVKATKHPKEATDLLTYLQSDEALNVFKKYGFATSESVKP